MSGIDDLTRWFELSDGTNSCKVHLYEALEYSQGYENFGGNTVHRMINGAGVKQSNWNKIRTTLSGNGGVPLGFSALDYSASLTLKCGVTRSISKSTNVIVIPANRRTDAGYLPTGFKLIDGFWVSADISVVSNTATVTLDANATAYMVQYFPQITVLMDNPSESYDWGDASSSWSITAEEV